MENIRKLALTMFLLMCLNTSNVFAIDVAKRDTAVPYTEFNVSTCEILMSKINQIQYQGTDVKTTLFVNRDTMDIPINVNGEDVSLPIDHLDVLACGIKTGDISLWMVPYYVRYFLEFLIALVGLVAVVGIVYGGYLYLISGVSDSKEQGKNAIKYGIIGFVLCMLAWAIVNVVMALATG